MKNDTMKFDKWVKQRKKNSFLRSTFSLLDRSASLSACMYVYILIHTGETFTNVPHSHENTIILYCLRRLFSTKEVAD